MHWPCSPLPVDCHLQILYNSSGEAFLTDKDLGLSSTGFEKAKTDLVDISEGVRQNHNARLLILNKASKGPVAARCAMMRDGLHIVITQYMPAKADLQRCIYWVARFVCDLHGGV